MCTATGTLARRAASSIAGSDPLKGRDGQKRLRRADDDGGIEFFRRLDVGADHLHVDGVEKAHAVAARLRVGKYLLHIVKRHVPTDLSFAVLGIQPYYSDTARFCKRFPGKSCGRGPKEADHASGIRLAGRGRARHPLGCQIRHEDNFTGAAVDGYRCDRLAGTAELAAALARAAALAGARGLKLFLWDAYRPQRAVDGFLRWCAAPEDGKTKRKHYPHIEKADIVPLGYVAARSGHSRGSAVDLTLARMDGGLLDMGGGFDLMDEISHHGANVGAEAARNRLLLRASWKRAALKPTKTSGGTIRCGTSRIRIRISTSWRNERARAGWRVGARFARATDSGRALRLVRSNLCGTRRSHVLGGHTRTPLCWGGRRYGLLRGGPPCWTWALALRDGVAGSCDGRARLPLWRGELMAGHARGLLMSRYARAPVARRARESAQKRAPRRPRRG